MVLLVASGTTSGEWYLLVASGTYWWRATHTGIEPVASGPTSGEW